MSVESLLNNDLGDSKVSELIALNRLDESSTELQKQGKHFEALEIMERALILRQHFFGSESNHVWESCKTIASLCNLLAMTMLQEQKYKSCLELLRKAEILSQNDFQSQAVTFNNFACYYRRQGQLSKSLKALQRAIRAEDNVGSIINGKAETNLNLCAVLSQLGRHSSALEKAQQALILLQQEKMKEGERNLLQHSETDQSLARIVVLGIAYHNVGVEQEFLNQLEAALDSYNHGLKAVFPGLNKNHRIVLSLEESVKAVSRRLHIARKNKLSYNLIRRSSKKTKRFKKTTATNKGNKWKSIKNAYGDLAYEIKPLSTLKIPRFKNRTTSGTTRNKLKLIEFGEQNNWQNKFGNLLSTESVQKAEADIV